MKNRKGMETVEARFWSKVQKTDGCWLWTASKNEHGYGKITVETRKGEKAHRLSWMLHYGPIPAGLGVLHKCDTPACVRPDHLFLGTQATNMRDCSEKLRAPHGEKASWSKLTEAQARSIISDARTQRVIAKQYGIGQQTVSEIKRGLIWGHLHRESA